MRAWPLGCSGVAGEEAAEGRLALAATHLQWASDISPARADRERRLLTAALHLTLAEDTRSLALRPAVEATAPSPLRSCVLGMMALSSGRSGEAHLLFSEALAQARNDPDSQPLAAMIASRLAHVYALLGEGGEGARLREVGAGHRLPERGFRQPDAHPDGYWHLPGGLAPRWPSWGTWMPTRPGSARPMPTACTGLLPDSPGSWAWR